MSPRREVIGGAELWLGRCEDVLPGLTGIDSLVTDPPYGIAYRTTYGRRRLPNGKWMEAAAFAPVIGDDAAFDPAALLGFRSIILWGANHYADRLPAASQWLVWDKRGPVIPARAQADCELAWTNIGGPARMIRHVWDGMVKDSERGESRAHPTQKPIAVMEWCLRFTDGTVCDPYMGSGTTGIAALKLGRPFIGIEVDEQHFATACRRIEAAHRQADLFVPPATPRPEQSALFAGEAAA